MRFIMGTRHIYDTNRNSALNVYAEAFYFIKKYQTAVTLC